MKASIVGSGLSEWRLRPGNLSIDGFFGADRALKEGEAYEACSSIGHGEGNPENEVRDWVRNERISCTTRHWGRNSRNHGGCQ